LKEGILKMSVKERNRLIVMNRVCEGEITLREGACDLGISYRQAKRIKSRFVQSGASGLIHRSRGRFSNRALPEELKKRALDLYREQYRDYGPTLATEEFSEEHGLYLHPETLRRWLHEAHLYDCKTHHRIHRKRRNRREHFGEMVQIDGSHHNWFEQRAKSCCLMVAVDDATGLSMGHMSKEETLQSAYTILYKWIKRHGVPESIYVDRKSMYTGDTNYYVHNKKTFEQGSGEFIRACEELGIRIISAHSPQAKGRVERKNGVFQDRLVKKLRRLKIDRIDQTNEMLYDFL